MEHDTTPQLSDADRGQVTTSAAEIYDAFFVPALFAQFAEPVLDHAGVGAGASVVDVGCGTGVVASAAVGRVGPGGRVVGLDPNDGMLVVARRREGQVEWCSGVAEQIPYPDDTFDHVLCQFAAMFFDDRGAACREMARVVRPGGTVTLATWSGLDRTPGYEAMVALIADELGDAAADALRAPFVLGEVDVVRDLLTSISDDVRLDEVPGSARFASIADWVHTDVRGWTLSDLIDDEQERALVARAERELAQFVGADGAVVFPAPALVGTAAPL